MNFINSFATVHTVCEYVCICDECVYVYVYERGGRGEGGREEECYGDPLMG